MSTRSHINFITKTKYKGEPKTHVEETLIYKHSDGYPDGEHGVVEFMREFVKWAEGDLTCHEYMIANFILFGKLNSIANYEEYSNTRKGKKPLTPRDILDNKLDRFVWSTGYGIITNNARHWDCAFDYEVLVDLTKYKGSNFEPIVKIRHKSSSKKTYSKWIKLR